MTLAYAAGMITALLLTDGPFRVRVPLALLWPLGPAALVVTVAILVGASVVAYPLVWVGIAALAGVVWLTMVS